MMSLQGFLVMLFVFIVGCAASIPPFCNPDNVLCVEFGGLSTITQTIEECSVHSSPCIIMIEGGGYAENVMFDTTVGSTTDGVVGELMPYPGELVRIWGAVRGAALKFETDSKHWKIWGGPDGGRIEFRNTNLQYGYYDSIALLYGKLENVQIGPGISFTFPYRHEFGSAIQLQGEFSGIVLEDIEIVGHETLRLTTTANFMEVFLAEGHPLGDYDYHLRVSGLRVSNPGAWKGADGIAISNGKMLIERSYFSSPDPYVQGRTHLHTFRSDLTVQNCVFEMIQGSSAFKIRDFPSAPVDREVILDHNTFSCLPSDPPVTTGIIQMCGTVAFLTVSNSLFLGPCGGTGSGEELIQEYWDSSSCTSGCSATQCTSATGLILCNRANESFSFLPGSSGFTDENEDCPSGGTGLEIELNETGSKPDPYFRTVAEYRGVGVLPLDDYAGDSRTTWNLGAFDLFVNDFCFGIHQEDPSVCGGHGTCMIDGTCSCWDEDLWIAENCSVPICDEIPATEHDLVCNGPENECIAPDECDCDDQKWGGQFCEIMRCFGVNWDSLDVCNGHGLCLEQHECLCVGGLDPDNACEKNEDDPLPSNTEVVGSDGSKSWAVSTTVVMALALAVVAILCAVILVLIILKRKPVAEKPTSEEMPMRDQFAAEPKAEEPAKTAATVLRDELFSEPLSRRESRRMSMSISVREFVPLNSVVKKVIFHLDDGRNRRVVMQSLGDIVVLASQIANVDVTVFDESGVLQLTLDLLDQSRHVLNFKGEDNHALTRCLSCLLEVRV